MTYEQSMFMAGVVVLGASAEGNIVFTEDAGKVFVAKKLFCSATSSDFNLKDWKDGHNRSWVRGKTDTDLVAGLHLVTAAGLPTILPLPIVVYGTDQHTVKLIDTSAAPNTVKLTLIGEELDFAAFKRKYPDTARAIGLV